MIIAAIAAGTVISALPFASMPADIMAAEEADTTEGTEQKHQIITQAMTWNGGPDRTITPEEYAALGQVTADRSEAEAGETVTIRAVDGTSAFFWPRFYIERISDGTEVTEALLGERERHDMNGESFTMPDYDIRVYAYTAEAWSSVPYPSLSVDGYDPNEYLIHSLQIEQTEGGTVSVVNTD